MFLTAEANSNLRIIEKPPEEEGLERAPSSFILESITEKAKNIKAPPDFDKAFMQIDEFNPQNMGAKSNNLRKLKENLPDWIHLPESGCIPFKVMEYTLDKQQLIKSKLTKCIESLGKVKSKHRMNTLLNRCKELIMALDFDPGDEHHAYIK